jgi:hypothetical protein
VGTFSVAPSNAKNFMLIDVTQAAKDWQSGAKANWAYFSAFLPVGHNDWVKQQGKRRN